MFHIHNNQYHLHIVLQIECVGIYSNHGKCNLFKTQHENRKDWHWTHLWWRSLHEYKLRFSYNGNFHKSSLGRLVWHTSGWIVRCLLTLFGIRYESNMDDTYIVLPGKSYILAHPCSRCRYGIVGNKQAYAKSYEASKYNDKNWFKLMKTFLTIRKYKQ